ncbi:hypothetical protein QZN29_22330, partial [Burkholderia multivorans]|nr:hypothetical protein [Burkholderia multivorans]MDN8134518.1 hypothetical protein [Burkholderia multivorans]
LPAISGTIRNDRSGLSRKPRAARAARLSAAASGDGIHRFRREQSRVMGARLAAPNRKARL